MAISDGNVILRKASGTFAGQIVFRQRHGKTVMCKMPKPYPPKTPTQIANQERFKRANDFAKAAIKDPVKKAYYKSIAKPQQTAFNAAFQDAYHKPEVEVKVAEGKVTVRVKGKHRVTNVKVAVAGREGYAVLRKDGWEFLLRDVGNVRVWVYDVAGNICVREIITPRS